MKAKPVHGALFGLAIGDALGVPVEFKKRDELKGKWVRDFEGYQTHNQPPGTFSDDSSLTFCLAESLCHGYDLNDMGQRFVKWFFEGYWTAGGEVFGVGKSTEDSITRLRDGVSPLQSGNYAVDCYGNGSLMRVLPLLFYIKDFDIEERYRIIREVAVITHGSIRTILACFYYLEFARELLNGSEKMMALLKTQHTVYNCIRGKNIPPEEMEIAEVLIRGRMFMKNVDSIITIHHAHLTIEAAVFCLLRTGSYEEAVLRP
ncbi:ADP-ribosylglycohydrolase [Chitinophagaceae bacterium OAS944]|nr:ADP-ribosylglycohydrolase [Chitinophagaceae bacterium OAS944]